MGAVQYENIGIAKGGIHQCYRQACESARDYNGHQEGYSGDVQTSSGYVDKTIFAPRYGTKKFWNWVEKVRTEKYEPAIAVEIKGKNAAEIKARNGYKGLRGIKVFMFFGEAPC